MPPCAHRRTRVHFTPLWALSLDTLSSLQRMCGCVTNTYRQVNERSTDYTVIPGGYSLHMAAMISGVRVKVTVLAPKFVCSWTSKREVLTPGCCSFASLGGNADCGGDTATLYATDPHMHTRTWCCSQNSSSVRVPPPTNCSCASLSRASESSALSRARCSGVSCAYCWFRCSGVNPCRQHGHE